MTRKKATKHICNTKIWQTRSMCRGFSFFRVYFVKQISRVSRFALFHSRSGNFVKHKGIFLRGSQWNCEKTIARENSTNCETWVGNSRACTFLLADSHAMFVAILRVVCGWLSKNHIKEAWGPENPCRALTVVKIGKILKNSQSIH